MMWLVVALHKEGLPEDINGIKVYRIKNRSSIQSLADNMSHINSFIATLKYEASIVKDLFPGVIHCNDLDALVIGVYIKKFINSNIKLVYDSHEYQFEDVGIFYNKKCVRLYKIIERYCIKYADRVITVSNSIAEEYKRLYKIDKPCLVLNSPNIYTQAQKKNLLREKLGISNKSKILIYQGGFSKDRGNDIMLELFKQRSGDDVVMVFMGMTYDKVFLDEIISAAEVYDNIYYLPAVPFNEILDYTSSADFGVSMIKDNCLNHRFCLPNKFFEYAMAGLPVISSGSIEMKAMIDKYQMGVYFDGFDVDLFNSAINQILSLDYDEISDNARKCAEENSWEVQEKNLIELYNNISGN
ncbi:glycosyltransferase [Francisella philomiragia]|uniref:glycosyltransferase n=1 Tax=Francisella philomiragia TaxID=28110 RepID=UPI0019064D28|nr:glycosyltransferase [Francisella philomiragia]MBK2026288.1 glycosyltransferase [Francisella philomiragia]